MTEEEIKAAIVAVNKFMYFSWNYGLVPADWITPYGTEANGYIPKFLKEASWTCSLGHMVAKWNDACINSRDSHSIISHFYSELDFHNRKAMLEWIVCNYNDELKLF